MIEVGLCKAHEHQKDNFDLIKELSRIQDYINKNNYSVLEGMVDFLILGAYYNDFEKKTLFTAVLTNNTGKAICEYHSVVRIACKDDEKIEFAKMTMDFDKEFLGTIENERAVLLHLNIPTRGLREDMAIRLSSLVVKVDDTRVTYDEQ